MPSPSGSSSSQELLAELLQAFAKGAAQRLGQLSVEGIIKAIQSLHREHQGKLGGQVPHVNSNAVRAYLRGSLFNTFTRDQVEAWALWHLAQMPCAEGASLLEIAVAAGGDDIGAIMCQLVKYFAGPAEG